MFPEHQGWRRIWAALGSRHAADEDLLLDAVRTVLSGDEELALVAFREEVLHLIAMAVLARQFSVLFATGFFVEVPKDILTVPSKLGDALTNVIECEVKALLFWGATLAGSPAFD